MDNDDISKIDKLIEIENMTFRQIILSPHDLRALTFVNTLLLSKMNLYMALA